MTGPACPMCGSLESEVICEGSDRLFRTTEEIFRVVRCTVCGMHHLDPRPGAADLWRYYPSNYWYDPDASAADRWAEAWRRFVLRDHVRFVRGAVHAAPPEGAVVDIGCGGGLLLRELGLPASRMAGLDYSEAALRVAWHTNGVPAVRASLPASPLRNGSCSVVMMFHVLEHLPEPDSFVQAARDMLLRGGRLVAQVPNADCWQFRLLQSRWNGLDIPRHLSDFRARDLKNLLERNGLRVRRVKHFSLRDNPAGLATSLAPGLDPMGRRARKKPESGAARLLRDVTYLGLTLAAIPFTVMEAMAGAGSSVMMEAERP